MHRMRRRGFDWRQSVCGGGTTHTSLLAARKTPCATLPRTKRFREERAWVPRTIRSALETPARNRQWFRRLPLRPVPPATPSSDVDEDNLRAALLREQCGPAQRAVRPLREVGGDENGLHQFCSAILAWSTASLYLLTILFSTSRITSSATPGMVHWRSWIKDSGRVSNRTFMKGA